MKTKRIALILALTSLLFFCSRLLVQAGTRIRSFFPAGYLQANFAPSREEGWRANGVSLGMAFTTPILLCPRNSFLNFSILPEGNFTQLAGPQAFKRGINNYFFSLALFLKGDYAVAKNIFLSTAGGPVVKREWYEGPAEFFSVYHYFGMGIRAGIEIYPVPDQGISISYNYYVYNIADKGLNKWDVKIGYIFLKGERF